MHRADQAKARSPLPDAVPDPGVRPNPSPPGSGATLGPLSGPRRRAASSRVLRRERPASGAAAAPLPQPPSRTPERPGAVPGICQCALYSGRQLPSVMFSNNPTPLPLPAYKRASVIKPGSSFLTTPTPSRRRVSPVRQRLWLSSAPSPPFCLPPGSARCRRRLSVLASA